jgi:hypothetical protein
MWIGPLGEPYFVVFEVPVVALVCRGDACILCRLPQVFSFSTYVLALNGGCLF